MSRFCVVKYSCMVEQEGKPARAVSLTDGIVHAQEGVFALVELLDRPAERATEAWMAGVGFKGDVVRVPLTAIRFV